MLTKNRLDKSFGPVGVSAGSVLFISGLILSIFSLSGLILVFLGAFIGFSSTGSIIDPVHHRIKFLNLIFGIIPLGKWTSLDSSMKIGIKESNVVWSAISRGNRQLDIQKDDFRIALYDANQQEIMEIKKFDTLISAESGLQHWSALLGLNQL